MLSYLEEQDTPAVYMDEAWYEYEPADGKYSKIKGRTDRQARVYVRRAIDELQAAVHKFDPRAAAVAYLEGGKAEHLLFSYAKDISSEEFQLICDQEDWARSHRYAIEALEDQVSEVADAMLEAVLERNRVRDIAERVYEAKDPYRLYHPMNDSGMDYADVSGHDGCCNEGGGYLPFFEGIPLKAASYCPSYTDVPTPNWDRLCELVWPDPQVREAALRSLSMGFTGRATKYVIYWRSETGLGKSIMAALAKDMLGDYARNVPAKLLFGYSADPQRAAQELAGHWLVVCEEGLGSNSFKADEAFKAVTTGGGDLNTRKLFHESEEQEATHTILLAVNPEADMNYADPAILNRLVSVAFLGFANRAAIEEMATWYNPKTKAWKAEAPYVLAKMLEYARDFAEGKWKPYTLLDLKKAGVLSLAVDEDTALAIEMKTSTNVADWVYAERKRLSAHTWQGRKLYDEYTKWCAGGQFGGPSRGEVLTETKWGRELKAVPGVTKGTGTSGSDKGKTVYTIEPA
jgi:hypothetical protein